METRNKLIASGVAVALIGWGAVESGNRLEDRDQCQKRDFIGEFACAWTNDPLPELTSTTDATLQPDTPPIAGEIPTTTEHVPVPGRRKEEIPEQTFIIHTADGDFAWPIGRADKSLIYTGHPFTPPCAPTSCHWDGTAAMDIGYKNPDDVTAQIFPTDTEIVGEPVWAFTNGTVVSVREDPKAPDCYRIQFLGNNGQYYWYGHLSNPGVADGQVLAVGTKMAEVGDFSCVPDGQATSYAHGHFDQGCSVDGVPQHGGNDECRSPDAIVILNTIWQYMPDSTESV